MKRKIILPLFCLIFSAQLSAQYIGKFSIATKNNKSKSSVSADTVKKVIADYDSLARIFNIQKNSNQLSSSKIAEFVSIARAAAKKLNSKKLDSLANLLDTVPINKVPTVDESVKADSVLAQITGNKEEPGAATCDDLSKISGLTADKNNEGEYVFSFVDNAENPIASFELKQYNEALFYDKAKSSLNSICGGASLTQEQKDLIDEVIKKMADDKLFSKLLVASLEVNDDDVPAGKLTINKHVNVALKRNKSAVNLDFTVYEIQIQFQDGFIENIKVLGKRSGDPHLLKFENAFPIPFSTRRDFRKLYEVYLFERTIYANKINSKSSITDCKLRLGDLLYYSQNLDLNVKDYSPENQTLERKITDEKDTLQISLNKERTSKILELKVFSDLKGIDGTNPNGLVQLELSKKLNLWNNRHAGARNYFNYGILNYITPYFTMNKIENDDKRLLLSYFGTKSPNDTISANVYASSLRILQHQTFGLGLNITGFTVDVPGLKSVFNLNTGFYYGRTLFQDTLREKVDSSNFQPVATNNVLQFGLNSFQIVPELTWQIFPDKRFGVMLSQKFINFKLLSSDVKQVRDSAHYVNYLKSLNGDRSKINDYEAKRWLGSSELFAFYQPSKYNKVFFRYRFNWDLDNVKENFYQMQIGLLTYLSHTRKSKKEKEKDDE